MEETSSPVNMQMLTRQMLPNLPHSEASASPLAPPPQTYPPDECLHLPRAKSSLDACVYGLPPPRHCGFLPSWQHPSIRPNSSLKENRDKYGDGLNLMQNNPSPQVNCHLFSPPTNLDTQPITPSPRSSSTLHDNSIGWILTNVESRKIPGSETGTEGKRIGYDGTNQTPSFQLLKPTASSLGHRAQKAGARSNQVMPLPPTLLDCRPNSLDSTKANPDAHDVAFSTPHFCDRAMGSHAAKMSFNTLASLPIDPFGKLNTSNRSDIATSDDEEDFASMTQNSSHLLDDFDFDIEATEEERLNHHHLHDPPARFSGSKPEGNVIPPPQTVLQRCASWSPGSRMLQRHNTERLRSHNMDPVASQLLRACVVHEGEQEDQQHEDPLSMSSHAFGQLPEAARASTDDVSLCQSPLPSSNSTGNFGFSAASMPELLSPIRFASTNDQGASQCVMMISEGSPLNYPRSPLPFFGDAPDGLLDDRTDIKSLARPVPRKFGTPAFAGSPFLSRTSSLPRHM